MSRRYAPPLGAHQSRSSAGAQGHCQPHGQAQVAACAEFCEDRVVVDKNLITSRAPGTALEFALRLVEVLVGSEKMLQIKAQTLAIL